MSSASSTSVSATSSPSAMPSSWESLSVSSRSSASSDSTSDCLEAVCPRPSPVSARLLGQLEPGGGRRRAVAGKPPPPLEMLRRTGGAGREHLGGLAGPAASGSLVSTSATATASGAAASLLARSAGARPGSRMSSSTNMKPRCVNRGPADLQSMTMSATLETTITSQPSAAFRLANSNRKSPTRQPKGTHCTAEGSRSRQAPPCHSRQRRL
mmetsp:Transcript_30528/g.90534  ORF Transcript_30528/g.90534 Transcript_30528/m.90534 type:complete len:212 (+) Transcript_30528:542-1177(+)